MSVHADDLAELLDALAVPSAHIAGISYGGEVAQAFALRYGGRARSLILADTVSEVGPALRLTVAGWMAAARTGDAGAFYAVTMPWNFSPEDIAANPTLVAAARQRYELLDFPAVARLCECFFGVDFTSRLGEIRAPTCIIYGEQDLLKGRAYAEILARGIPHAEVHVLRGAGHASCWEQPAAFNSIVLGFLTKQEV